MLKFAHWTSVVATALATGVPILSSAQPLDNLNVTVASSSFSTGLTTLSVIDPFTPDQPLLKVDLPTAEARWAKTNAFAVEDAAARKLRFLGELEMHYLRDSRLYLADTRSAAVVARQISSETALCGLLGQWPWRLDGSSDVSIVASTAGPDGNCAGSADNGSVALRASMDANDAAVAMPAGLRGVSGLYANNVDPLQWLLLNDPGERRLRIFSRTGAEEGRILGPNRQIDEFVAVAGPDPLAPAALYLCSGDGLYRLAWNEAGAALALVYRFAQSFDCGLESFTHDAEHTWFSDGRRLLRLRGAGPPVVQQAFSEEIAQVEHTPTRVLVGLRGISDSKSVHSMPKPGGPVTRLATAQPGGYDLVIIPSLSAAVTLHEDNVEFYGIDRVFVVSDDGTRRQTLLDNVEVVGSTSANVTSQGIRQATGVLFCEDADDFDSCAGSVLGQLDLTKKSVTALGTFPDAGRRRVTGRGIDRHPLSFEVRADSVDIEAWLAKPSGEGSMTRVAPVGPP